MHQIRSGYYLKIAECRLIQFCTKLTHNSFVYMQLRLKRINKGMMCI